MNHVHKNSLLIVEDDNLALMTLIHILSPDYTVYVVKSGKDAIRAIEKYVPDIILLDILLPGEAVDGYNIMDALKKSERTRNIPIIFITGLNETEDEIKGLSLGAVDYIKKPFSPPIVKLRIQNQIRMLEQYRTIERLSMTDQLTSLPNRHRFESRLKTEWARAIREQEPISILLVDIDELKDYNSVFGQEQGDLAVKAVANVFSKTIKRPSDFAARWSEEEFSVLLPGTDSSGAFHVAEEIRHKVESLAVKAAKPAAEKITVSIGVSTVENERTREKRLFDSEEKRNLYKASMGIDSGGSQETALYKLIADANKALSIAKDKGRNRTVFLTDAIGLPALGKQ
ncbi:MAG: diguanylate cyclase [Spirochaetes bacterium]|nr:diguanylate cyclase [Spirochaetota bacterium]